MTNGVCGEVTSTDAAVTVDACPGRRHGGGRVVGGLLQQRYQHHFDRADRGIEKWQSSTDNWATTNDLDSADNPLLTGDLATNTVFRAVVTNGVCGEAYSMEAGVTVDATPVGARRWPRLRGLLQQRHEHHFDRPDRKDPDVAVLDGQLGDDQ